MCEEKSPDAVILVDGEDRPIGTIGKLEAHQQGLLHRAFSIFIFDAEGKMLLQQRSQTKYHNPGMWSNACCSHPLPGEDTLKAAERRLQEEMGFTVPLVKAFDFIYNVSFDNGLAEHEFDHVYIGQYEGEIIFDPFEVEAYSYKYIPEIKLLLKSQPASFTEWFKIAFPKIEEQWQLQFNS